MNYFERLIRRALRRPASAPGAAPQDPFTNVADWPLQAPATSHAQSALPADPPLPAPQAARSVEHPAGGPDFESTGRANPVPSAIAESPVPEMSPPLPLAAPFDPPMEAEKPQPQASPAAMPLAPAREALELADSFMRNLGVKSQLPDLPVRAELSAPVSPPASPAADQASARSMPLEIVAPVSPPPALPPLQRMPQQSVPQTPLTKPAESEREPARRARSMVETRHVVVEHRTAAADPKGDAISGGGAPHFGLGQL